MKNVLKFGSALALALAFVAFAVPVRADDDSFVLHNHTGRVMKALYVSVSTSKEWGDDIMGSQVAEDGQDVTVTFPRDATECNWDVRGEFNDGTYAEVDNVDFCTVTEVTFTP